MRINIGCGKTPTPGWRNFDNSPSLLAAKIPLLPELLDLLGVLSDSQLEFIRFAQHKSIQYANASNTIPVDDNIVDVLYASHMLEHLSRTHEVPAFLSEAYRVLRVGGVIRLVVPDLQKLTNFYLSQGDADTFVNRTSLVCECATTLLDRLQFLFTKHRSHHLWMYDGDSLTELLREHGFVKPTVVTPGQTRIEDPASLNLYERSEESVYVEATKPNE